ncbi:MAG: cyclic nucleotide-binding domain-containing protein [bacterium]
MENNIIRKSSFWTNFFKTPQKMDTLSKVFLSNPIFSKLKQKDLDLLIKSIHSRVYQSGEYIFLQGDPGIGLYIIIEGEVKIITDIGNDNKYTLVELSQGDFFGELSLLNDENRSASALASTDTKIAIIFKPDLDEFIDRFPQKGISVLRGISQVLATRLKNMNEDFFNLYIKTYELNKEVKNGNDKENISTH